MLELFVPGRVCIFGEHSDWASSYRESNHSITKGNAIVACCEQGLFARVSSSSRLTIHSTFGQRESVYHFDCSVNHNELDLHSHSNNWYSYICGCVAELLDSNLIQENDGIILDNFLSTLPIKKGLSSSASICVLAIRAYNKLYGLNLSLDSEMLYAYLGELRAGSQCGKLDQIVAYGVGLYLIEFDKKITIQRINNNNSIYITLIDLNKSKDTKLILSSLSRAYPFHNDNELYKNIHYLLGKSNQEIIHDALSLIKQNDLDDISFNMKMGALMKIAQTRFDKYATPLCPDELSAPILHATLSSVRHLACGGKGVGSQGDGTAQCLSTSLKDQEILIRFVTEELNLRCFTLNISTTNR